jgi:hypothetical protein
MISSLVSSSRREADCDEHGLAHATAQLAPQIRKEHSALLAAPHQVRAGATGSEWDVVRANPGCDIRQDTDGGAVAAPGANAAPTQSMAVLPERVLNVTYGVSATWSARRKRKM